MKTIVGNALTVAIAALCAAAAYGGDKSYSTKSAEAEVRMMDADKDGKISQAEHQTGVQEMFLGMDANQDGRVTVEEMDARHRMKSTDSQHAEHADKHHTKSAAEKIRTVDANGDGVLTAQEHAMGAKKMFTKMDANKDGFLTKEEIKSGHETMVTKDD